MSSHRPLKPIPKSSLFFALQERERKRIIDKAMRDAGIPEQWKEDVALELIYRFAKTPCAPPGEKPKGQIISLAKTVAHHWSIRSKMEMCLPVRVPDKEATADKRRREFIAKAKEEGRELKAEDIPTVHRFQSVYLDDDDTHVEITDTSYEDPSMLGDDLQSDVTVNELSELQLKVVAHIIDELPAGLMRFARHLLDGYSAEQAGDIEGVKSGTASSYLERLHEAVDKIVGKASKEAGITR